MSSLSDDYRSKLPEGPRGDLQFALTRVLKSLVFRGDPNSPLNEMPLSQLKCLHIVGESEGQKMIDIAHRMEIGLPAVSQIVDRLVRRGHFERQPDPLDRRVVRVVLTETARGLLADGRRYYQMRMDAALDLMNEQAVREVTRGLEMLADAGEQADAAEKAVSAETTFEFELEEPVRVGGDPLVEMMAERARSRRKRAQPEVLPVGKSGRL